MPPKMDSLHDIIVDILIDKEGFRAAQPPMKFVESGPDGQLTLDLRKNKPFNFITHCSMVPQFTES